MVIDGAQVDDAIVAKARSFRVNEEVRTPIDAHAQALIDILKGRNGKIKISLESVRELIFSTWIWEYKKERGIK